jgi:hypothetical protein
MRCVQQVSLLRLWERLRGENKIPEFGALVPEDISRSIDKLSFSEVVHTVEGPRFRIVRNGAQFERIYPVNRVGKFLDETLPPAIREQALHHYKLVVVSQQPSFSFSVLRKNAGPFIRYERLLLPFTCHGGDVERIVGVITLFSEENGFDASDVATAKLI